MVNSNSSTGILRLSVILASIKNGRPAFVTSRALSKAAGNSLEERTVIDSTPIAWAIIAKS